jgi:hypothetical protein
MTIDVTALADLRGGARFAAGVLADAVQSAVDAGVPTDTIEAIVDQAIEWIDNQPIDLIPTTERQRP